MKPITGEVLIDAPVETVFDMVADERNEPRYNTGMVSAEKLTPGPIGTGTRFAAVIRTRGKRTPATIEYTAFARPRSLTSLSRMGQMDVKGDLTFTAEGERTVFRWSWQLHPRRALRVLGPLIRAVGRRQERANWHAMKEYVEAASAGIVAGRGGTESVPPSP